jgi:hypothetical protein
MNETYTEEELQKLPFRNSKLALEKRVEDLLSRLTLEEKFKLSAGRMMLHTKPIKRLGITGHMAFDLALQARLKAHISLPRSVGLQHGILNCRTNLEKLSLKKYGRWVPICF